MQGAKFSRKECVSLGLQIGQLARDIKERPEKRQTEGV